MKSTQGGDPTKVWVYGKAEPGWYVARWVWNQQYANEITSLGYQVQRSKDKPE